MPTPTELAVPGRYQVFGHNGRRTEKLHRWTKEEHAIANADDVLAHGRSPETHKQYDRVTVDDRIDRRTIYESKRNKRRYGTI